MTEQGEDQRLGEQAGKAWSERYPHLVDQARTVIIGDFSNNPCHANRRPDDFICPTCFEEFVTRIYEIDPTIADEMRSNKYTWTRAWITAILA